MYYPYPKNKISYLKFKIEDLALLYFNISSSYAYNECMHAKKSTW